MSAVGMEHGCALVAILSAPLSKFSGSAPGDRTKPGRFELKKSTAFQLRFKNLCLTFGTWNYGVQIKTVLKSILPADSGGTERPIMPGSNVENYTC